MDSNFTGFSDLINGYKIDDQASLPFSDQYLDVRNGFGFNIAPPDLNFMNIPSPSPDPDPGHLSTSSSGGLFTPSNSWSPEGEAHSPSDDSETSDPVLKYISQMLMEENMEDKPSMFYDPLTLQATEKSLYDIIGEHPSVLNQSQFFVSLNSESPDGRLSGLNGDYGSNHGTSTSTSTRTSNFVEPQWVNEIGDHNSSSQTPFPGDLILQFDSQQPPQFSVNQTDTLRNSGQVPVDASVNELFVQNIFSDEESIMQFRRGLEEASKFLPSGGQLTLDLGVKNLVPAQKDETENVAVQAGNNQGENSPDGLRGRKNHEREFVDFGEERSNKQSAVYTDESELSEMFDKVLLFTDVKCNEPSQCSAEEIVEMQSEPSKISQQNGHSNGANGGKTRAKRQGKKKDTVDLRSLLILCAQATSGADSRTANELLKQIRQHSSPLGDGSQRLAYYFADGLEARLAGNGAGIQNKHASKRITAADKLKAYKVYLSACPFKKLPIFFANKMILDAAEKATTLHIVDFGILYGFQWPFLIQNLSMRPGGAPKLRITGIEIPQPGFRPLERIEETGRRLARYCERFNVPFEYNPIAAQNWETIKIEDLKLQSNEVLAVNCLFRFKNLLDESVEVNCPRNAVLDLIRKMNPDIFVHSIVNGAYNAPFFVTRFREAVFHFSALFDMFDTTLPSDDPERLMMEREFYGRDAINVIACEGLERVERPESYKQWQARNMRAGFKQLPLDQELLKKFRAKLKAWYHKDFVIDVDGEWMLQGWKGRILYASSGWIPA